MDNNAAQAYAAKAMENCGISPLTIGRVMNEMWMLFDEVSEREIVEKAGRIRATADTAVSRRRYS